ncbi:MAG TPA: hypothetical protein EYP63_01525 [Desulfotomaculum sp.]|nr:hypothetical protein [Desulfotomaculum sp.]
MARKDKAERGDRLKIDSYRFGEIIISGKRHTGDVIVLPERVLSWWRKTGHAVELADLKAVIDAGPEILIIGTGAYGAMRVLPEVNDFFSSKGIPVIVLLSSAACEKYNELCETQRTALAIHLTC